MIGPFLPSQGTSSQETVIDVAVTDEKVILLTDEKGATNDNNYTDKHDCIVLPVGSVLAEY